MHLSNKSFVKEIKMKKDIKIPFALIFSAALELCTGGRVLYLAPIPSKSHFILSERLVEELAERGHEVIVVAPFKRLRPVENINEIVIPDVSDSLFDKALLMNASEDKFQMRYKMSSAYSTSNGAEALMEKTMTHQEIIDLLNSEEEIDLVVGISASTEGLLAGFAHRFKAPLVVISTSVPYTNINEMVGNPAPSSYVPDGSLEYNDHMNFCQRFVNFCYGIASQIAFYWSHLPRQDNLMRKYFGDNLPPLKELLMNNSLVLANHHFSLGFPRPNLPNVIEIGGFHVKPAKPLPKDLQNFISEATDGVIYFSMGSSLKSEDIPTEKIDGILNAFSNLTQRVLWKFDGKNFQNLPENLKISKWLPQSDILAHPNVKLFITHGGLLSLTESIYRGIPIVGIPMYPEQFNNVKHIENLKVGVQIDFQDINEETLSRVIQQVLNNSTYSTNAKFRSEILRDRPVPPIDLALYWLEYVMRYKGAAHLKSGAQHLSWYQLYQLDVLLLIGIVSFVGFFIMHKFCGSVVRTLREVNIEEIPFLKKNN